MRNTGQSGTSLVEVMVAGALLALAITATATMVKAGNDMMYKKNLERQARRLVYSALEDPRFHYFPDYNGLEARAILFSDTLDKNDRPVPAVVTVIPAPEGTEVWPMSSTTWWRRVDAKVIWTVEGVSDSVTATKILGEIR